MQLGVKDKPTTSQQKDNDIVDNNDNQGGEDNSTNGKNINANIRTLTESNGELLNKNNNNNEISNNIVNNTVSSTEAAAAAEAITTKTTGTSTAAINTNVKNYNKLYKKKNIIKGQETKTKKLKDTTRIENADKEEIRKNELVDKQNVATVSNKSSTGQEKSMEKKDKDSKNNIDNVDANIINQEFRPLIDIKIQYNRKQLMELRGSKESFILPNLNNIEIFSHRKTQSMIGEFGLARRSIVENGSYQNLPSDSDKSMIYLNLSLNQEIQLKEAENAWRPKMMTRSTDDQADAENTAQSEKDDLIRQVRGILNKLTPEKFEPLVGELIKLKIDNLDKIQAVMILIFEKAIDEPNFAVSYANMCYRLINEVKTDEKRGENKRKINHLAFLNALINKVEHEFTQNIMKRDAKEEKLRTIREQISNCKDVNEKIELEDLMGEEERKIRRRSGGTVRFIGELFQISMLTGRIIYSCIEGLLKNPNEDMLECLCKLLTTVGQKYEQTTIQTNTQSHKCSLDTVIERMQEIIECKNGNLKVSSRVRFMLQDVIDLRKKNWQSTRNETPKTMDEIKKETINEKLNNQCQYVNSVYANNISARRDERTNVYNEGRNCLDSPSQRNKNDSVTRQHRAVKFGGQSHAVDLNDDDKWQIQTGKGNRTVVVDSSKLFGMAVDMNNKKMGGVHLFNWNTGSAQPKATVSNSFAELAMDLGASSNRAIERDYSSTRNKGSYKKNSMKRDRFNDSRQSRQNFPSIPKEISAYDGSNLSNAHKYSSHSKYHNQPKSPMSTLPKRSFITTDIVGVNNLNGCSLYPDKKQTVSCSDLKTNQEQSAKTTSSDDLSFTTSVKSDEFVDPTNVELKLFKDVVDEMVENAANSECMNTIVASVNKIKKNQMCGLIYYILTDYLHLADVGPAFRKHLSNIVAYLFEMKYLSTEQFCLAYNNFFKLADELIIDVPELWLYVFEFTGPLLVKKQICLKDLWNFELLENDLPSFSQKFLKTFLQYFTREWGLNFTRRIWKENHLKWTYFMSESDVDQYIETNKFEYVENENSQSVVSTKETVEKRNNRMTERIQELLKQGYNADDIIDYINGNITDIDKSFVQSLATILTRFVITHSKNCSLDSNCFQKVCIPVLLHYINSKEDLELECLAAVQLLIRSLEQQKGLLDSIYAELNEADVISEETLISWRKTTENI